MLRTPGQHSMRSLRVPCTPVAAGRLAGPHRLSIVRRQRHVALGMPGDAEGDAPPTASSSEAAQAAPAGSPTSNPGKKKRKAESTDAVASFLTRRFGVAGGAAWLAVLAAGSLGEQVKTRIEVIARGCCLPWGGGAFHACTRLAGRAGACLALRHPRLLRTRPTPLCSPPQLTPCSPCPRTHNCPPPPMPGAGGQRGEGGQGCGGRAGGGAAQRGALHRPAPGGRPVAGARPAGHPQLRVSGGAQARGAGSEGEGG